MSRKKLIESMKEQMIQTVKWYRDMNELDNTLKNPTNLYTDEILAKELENKARAYNELLVNQFNGKCWTISKSVWFYETEMEMRKYS